MNDHSHHQHHAGCSLGADTKTATDPVCGMKVDPHTTAHRATHDEVYGRGDFAGPGLDPRVDADDRRPSDTAEHDVARGDVERPIDTVRARAPRELRTWRSGRGRHRDCP